MRAHGNEGRLGRRFLLAAGLIIALVVPSAALRHLVLAEMRWRPRSVDGGRAREWEEQTGRGPGLLPVQSQVPEGARQADDSPDGSGQTHHRRCRPNAIAIDAKVQHRKWHFNELVRDAVGRSSNERIDATINFRGKFRKHNKNKADATLEVTLEAGGTYLYPFGTPLIVTGSRSPAASGRRRTGSAGPRTATASRTSTSIGTSIQRRGRRYTCSSAFRL